MQNAKVARATGEAPITFPAGFAIVWNTVNSLTYFAAAPTHTREGKQKI